MKVKLKEIKWVELNRFLKSINNVMRSLKSEIKQRKQEHKEYISLMVIERILSKYDHAAGRFKERVEKQLENKKDKKLDFWDD
ncbi:MAG: hypothetical protein KKA79_00385 [Nanoarchaeota archaeon]|nr:hypothetical protein [Nanoarchaeota archaeon]